MTLEQRIAQIVALNCLTPVERAEMILAQPEMARLHESDAEVAQRFACAAVRQHIDRIQGACAAAAQQLGQGGSHGRPSA